MELVGTLFTTMVGGGAAAAGAGAGAAGTVAASATGLSALQGVTTLFSTIATIGGGLAAKSSSRVEAKQHEFESRNEFIEGRETSAALKQELARTVSNQAIAFAAGGVGLDSVSVGTARRQATEDAERELEANTTGSLGRSMQRRRMAANARAQGSAAVFKSVVSAGQQIADFRVDQMARGLPNG